MLAINSTGSAVALDNDPSDFKDLDFDEYLPSLTLLIFFMFGIAFFFEFVLKGLDHFLKRNAPQLYDIAQQLYKELMVCGFISIFLWLSHYTDVISDITSQDLPDILFDFIQLVLFLSLGFYVLYMFYLMFLSLFFMRRWNDIESMDPGLVEQEYQEQKEELERMPWYERWVSWSSAARSFDLRKKYHYHIVRAQFILQQGLTDRFNFGSYLRKCMRSMVAEWVKIHWTIWLLVLVVISFSGLRYWVGASFSRTTSLYQFIGAGWVMLIVGILVCLKSRSVLHKLVSSNVLSVPIIATIDRTSMSSDMLSDYAPLDPDGAQAGDGAVGDIFGPYGVGSNINPYGFGYDNSEFPSFNQGPHLFPHDATDAGYPRNGPRDERNRGPNQNAPTRNSFTNTSTFAGAPSQGRRSPPRYNYGAGTTAGAAGGYQGGAAARLGPIASPGWRNPGSGSNYGNNGHVLPVGLGATGLLHVDSRYANPSTNSGTNRGRTGTGPGNRNYGDWQFRNVRTGAVTCDKYLRHILWVRPMRFFRRVWMRILNPFAYPSPEIPDQIQLFWFHSARFLLYVIRFLLFFHVGYLAMYILYFYSVANEVSAHYAHGVIIFPVIVFSFITIPYMLPTYSIIANVGYLTKHRLVALTIKQQQHEGTI